MRILVLNSGSSSLKFSLMEMATPEPDGECTGRQDILNGSVKGKGRADSSAMAHDYFALPKGRTGLKEADRLKAEGFWRSHHMPFVKLATTPDHIALLEQRKPS